MMMVTWRNAKDGCALVALMGMGLLAAACGSGGSNSGKSTAPSMSGSSPPTGGVVIGTTNGPVGTYLTDAGGRALYLWTGDSNGKSNCSGDCSTQWPPLITRTTAI